MDLFLFPYPRNTYTHILLDFIPKKKLRMHSNAFLKNYVRIKVNILQTTAGIFGMIPSANILASKMKSQKNYKKQQTELIENYIKPLGVTDSRVISAFRKVPRHKFVLANYRKDAYLDVPLPIGEGQTISQPSLVAVMTQALELKGREKVLEVGTGSGFQAAILSHLAKKVYTIEIIGRLADKAAKTLKNLECDNVHVEIGDGSQGLQKYAPYDAIIVTAAGNQIPQPLIDQLKVGGRIVIPVGESLYGQQLKVGKKVGNTIKIIDIEPVAFVPLRGKFGFEENFGRFDKSNKFKSKLLTVG